jgi:hypothetical protein
MTSRINIGRPASTSYHSPDPHGFANSRPSTGYRAANPDHPLERIRAVAKQVEDAIEIYSQPLKPHLPTIGRFLIIVTFYEDALRIMTQWNDQLWYLQTSVTGKFIAVRHSFNFIGCRHRFFYRGISHLFLLLNVIVSPHSKSCNSRI